MKAAYNLETEDSLLEEIDKNTFFYADEKEVDYHRHSIGDQEYIKVFPYGSAMHGSTRELARAGWGVFFG